MKMKSLRRFWRDEAGAVTVDWVVLTGGLIIFGVLVGQSIMAGTTDMSTGAGGRLANAQVPEISF